MGVTRYYGRVGNDRGGMRLNEQERAQLNATIAPYVCDERVRSMEQYVQHGAVSTLDHCRSVAEVSWWIAQRLHVHVDANVLLGGALLHDFYLYDWHGAGWRHSYRHAERARRNAEAYFGVDKRTQHVIRSHMWPLGITHVPRTREAIIVSMADKIVSLHETLFQRRKAKRICG